MSFRLKTLRSDMIYFLVYILLFFVISQSGIFKYFVLMAGIFFCFLYRKKIHIKYLSVLSHSIFYVVIGLFIAVATSNFSFESIKQSLIFLSSGLFSVALFSLYGEQNSDRLVDIQFYALCVVYLLLYGRYFTLETFYYESNLYAYIFGIYGIIYLLKKQYFRMVFALLFMLFDHKRIADGAFFIVFVCTLLVIALKNKKYQRGIYILARVMLFFIPVLWVLFCGNGMLVTIFAKLRINTMGRLEGVGAWNIAREYYEISPLYMGRGSGWVLEWLNYAEIPAFSNLHNDFLTAYIELGFWGYLFWLASFQCMIGRYKKLKGVKYANIFCVMFGFMFINLLTDNIYLYVTFLMPFYTILLSAIYGSENWFSVAQPFAANENCGRIQKKYIGS